MLTPEFVGELLMSMKKLLILSAAILSLANYVSAQVPKRHELVGAVRSLHSETAKLTEVGGENVEGPRVLIESVSYDDHRNVTEQVVNNRDGTLRWKITWNGGSTYDADGHELERVTNNASAEVISRTVSVYDGNGNRVKSITYGAAGEITSHSTFEYENGLKIRADHFKSSDSTRATELFTYDSQGRLSEIIRPENFTQYREGFKYDGRGNETEWSVYDKDGKRVLKVTAAYSDDSRGNPTEFRKYDSGDKLLMKEIYTYEFDSQGNWIKSKTSREMYRGQAPIIETEMTYRKITYR